MPSHSLNVRSTTALVTSPGVEHAVRAEKDTDTFRSHPVLSIKKIPAFLVKEIMKDRWNSRVVWDDAKKKFIQVKIKAEDLFKSKSSDLPPLHGPDLPPLYNARNEYVDSTVEGPEPPTYYKSSEGDQKGVRKRWEYGDTRAPRRKTTYGGYFREASKIGYDAASSVWQGRKYIGSVLIVSGTAGIIYAYRSGASPTLSAVVDRGVSQMDKAWVWGKTQIAMGGTSRLDGSTKSEASGGGGGTGGFATGGSSTVHCDCPKYPEPTSSAAAGMLGENLAKSLKCSEGFDVNMSAKSSTDEAIVSTIYTCKPAVTPINN